MWVKEYSAKRGLKGCEIQNIVPNFGGIFKGFIQILFKTIKPSECKAYLDKAHFFFSVLNFSPIKPYQTTLSSEKILQNFFYFFLSWEHSKVLLALRQSFNLLYISDFEQQQLILPQIFCMYTMYSTTVPLIYSKIS